MKLKPNLTYEMYLKLFYTIISRIFYIIFLN